MSGPEHGLGPVFGWGWRRELAASCHVGQGVTVGVVDVHVALGGAPQPVAAFVDGVVVVATEEHQFVQGGAVASFVGDGVVGVGPRGRDIAAREHAPAVSRHQRGAFGWGGLATVVDHAERLGGAGPVRWSV